jgi:acetyl-CoA synthetase
MSTEEMQWRSVVKGLREDHAPPDAYLDAWRETFLHWDATSRPAPFALVDPQIAAGSNLQQFMHEVGQVSYDELHTWSVSDPEGFWGAVLRRLQIPFQQAPSCMLGSEGALELRAWLPGAYWNVAEACLQGEPESIGILWGKTDGTIQKISHGTISSEVKRIAGSLRRHGFGPGSRLAILMPMTPEAVFLYLGMIYAGATVVSIADSFAPAEIGRRLTIAQADAIFVLDTYSRGGKTIELYRRVRDATEIPAIVLSETVPADLRNQDQTWNTFLLDDECSSPHHAPSNHMIHVLFSSGTTGEPKAIPWTQVTPLKSLSDAHFHQDIHPGDVVAWPTNLGWMMGPWLVFSALANQACLAIYEDVPTSRGFAEFVQNAKVTMLGVVPTIVNAWKAGRVAEGLDWSSIRCFSSTGEASNPNAMQYLSALAGCRPIIEYCGGTEIGGGFISSTVLHPNVCGAFSAPALGSRFVILDNAGLSASEGELFLVPPALGMSQQLLNRDHEATYYRDTPYTRDGIRLRRHGDFFQQLPGGYYVAGGRVDDTMNLGGIKTSSAEIERVLNRLPAIRETAAVALPPKDGGPDRLVIFVVPEPDLLDKRETQEIETSMNRSLKQELNPLFRVDEVILVEALPRTASNKVMRRELREQLKQRRT